MAVFMLISTTPEELKENRERRHSKNQRRVLNVSCFQSPNQSSYSSILVGERRLFSRDMALSVARRSNRGGKKMKRKIR
jgi:hypothetical protein